jgi:polyisoprenoid-binding protein YceI
MKHFAGAIFLAVPLAVLPAAFAQHETFDVNRDASRIGFSLAGTGHHIEGTFHVQGGSVSFDGEKKMTGSVVVAAASGNSGQRSRDQKMNSGILDAANFAEVTFAPRSYVGDIAPVGDSTIQVTGVFTLHGTPHDLTLPIEIHIEGSSLTAKGHFAVPYVQWGLKDPSWGFLRVGKEVGIDLTLSGQLRRVD